jgi:membrane-bound lytic murein transglycosylase F
VLTLLGLIVFELSYIYRNIPDWNSVQEGNKLIAIINRKEVDEQHLQTDDSSIAMLQALADSLDVELKLECEPDLKKAIKKLRQGKCHLIAHILPVTTQYENKICFSAPIFRTYPVLVQGKRILDEKKAFISDQYDLSNDTIHIQTHSAHKMRLEHLSDEIANPIHIVETPNKTALELVEMVARGEIKYTVAPRTFAEILQKEYPEIDTSLPVGFTQEYAWAVHPDATLLQIKVNLFLHNYLEHDHAAEKRSYLALYSKYNPQTGRRKLHFDRKVH